MSSGATVTFNDPRRFGSMKLVSARQARAGAVAACARTGAAGQRIRRRDAGARLRGQEDLAQGRADRSARRGRSRQHLCLRGAVSRAAVAQTARVDHRGPPRHAERARARHWSMPSRRCSRTRSRPAARRCAIIAAPTAHSAISSTISGSMIARASRARLQGHDQTHRADRPFDLLLPLMSEVGHAMSPVCRDR